GQLRGCLAQVALIGSAALLLLALLGSASLIATRKAFEGMHAARMSRWDAFDLELTAQEYAASLQTGDATMNAHVTVFGASVRLTLYGCLLLALAWALAYF